MGVFRVNKAHQKAMGDSLGTQRLRGSKCSPASWKPVAVSAEHQHVGTGPRPGSCSCFVSERLLDRISSARTGACFPVCICRLSVMC